MRTVAVPVATLEQGTQDQALLAALALVSEQSNDDLAVASRALVLASFNAGVRALLELGGGEGAVPLPVLVERVSVNATGRCSLFQARE